MITKRPLSLGAAGAFSLGAAPLSSLSATRTRDALVFDALGDDDLDKLFSLNVYRLYADVIR